MIHSFVYSDAEVKKRHLPYYTKINKSEYSRCSYECKTELERLKIENDWLLERLSNYEYISYERQEIPQPYSKINNLIKFQNILIND